MLWRLNSPGWPLFTAKYPSTLMTISAGSVTATFCTPRLETLKGAPLRILEWLRDQEKTALFSSVGLMVKVWLNERLSVGKSKPRVEVNRFVLPMTGLR